MAIQIITDSVADYPQKELERKQIIRVSMNVNFGAEQYLDGVDITQKEFYQKLEEGQEFPTTSQPSPAAFLDVFEDAKEKGDTVIAILVSEGLSGTIQSANLAKNMAEYDAIHIIDSKTATIGMKILVDQAVKMRDEGESAEKIVEAIEELRERVYLYAALDTLENLVKGGRLSKHAAGIGKLARIKPLITISRDGKVEMCGKAIGMKRACKTLTEWMEKEEIDTDYPMNFLYASEQENCKRFLASMKIAELCKSEGKAYGIGATIGTHIGAGAFGIVFVRKKA